MVSSATAAAASPYTGFQEAYERTNAKLAKYQEETIQIQEATVDAQALSEQTLRDENAVLRARLAENDAALEAKDKVLLIQKVAIAAHERENQQQREKNSQLSERDILLHEMIVIQKELVDKASTLWKRHCVEDDLDVFRQRYYGGHYDSYELNFYTKEYLDKGYAFHEGMPTYKHLLRIHELIKKAESLTKK